MVLGNNYAIERVEQGQENVVFRKGNMGLRIMKEEIICVEYEGINYALRGCLKLLSTHELTDDYTETSKISMLTCMLDNSRNAVASFDALKQFMARMALLGYSRLMLYTEDIYEISDYPAFGYLRGKYSKEELKGLNDYGRLLGIELVGCIQTLGHLQQIFHWKYFDNSRDAVANLMVDYEESYNLIDAMLKTMSDVFDSRVIMLGMDEVHSLGRGKHIDRFGYHNQKELFLLHLNKVKEIANKYGFTETYVWSDMFIKMNSTTHNYYEPETVTFHKDFIDDVADVTLGFWNYDEINSDRLIANLRKHEELNRKVILASGLATYFTTHYDHNISSHHLDAVYETVCTYNLQELIITIWLDDGAYCDPNTYSLGIYYLAEKMYCNGQVDEGKYEKLYGYNYALIERMSDINSELFKLPNLYFDDPILGIGYNNEYRKDKDIWNKALKHYTKLWKDLSVHEGINHTYKYASVVSEVCMYKILARISLVSAYKSNVALFEEAITYYSKLIVLTKELAVCHRKIWMEHFKTYGFDVMQVRYAGMVSRYEEAIVYIQEYVEGKHSKMAELDEIDNGLDYIKIKPLYKNIAHATIVL